jgi:hypothetical protein
VRAIDVPISVAKCGLFRGRAFAEATQDDRLGRHRDPGPFRAGADGDPEHA